MSKWTSQSAFDGVVAPEGRAGGLTVSERRGLQIATLMTLEPQASDLSRAIDQHFRCVLPVGPKRVTSGQITFLGIGPATWLAVADSREKNFVARMEAAAQGHGWVADQSDGLGVLRLGGPRVSDVLATGVPIDLDPAVFTSDDVAVTSIAHIGATLWKANNDHYDIAVFRSMAGSFWHWLHASAARYGIRIASEYS